MTETSAETGLMSEARRLIDRAADRGIVLRLLGGLAIQLLTPELPPRTRDGQDLDFASVRSSRKPLTEMLAEEGYVGDRNFNALYGDKQLYFTHGESGLAIDVMVDRLHMCHTVDFAERATVMPYTLSPTDLLLSKLQIVELNAKDLDDCLRLLVTFPLGDSDDPNLIDLRPGAVSNLAIAQVFPGLVSVSQKYDGTHALTMGFNTLVSNATGGSGSDAVAIGKINSASSLSSADFHIV